MEIEVIDLDKTPGAATSKDRETNTDVCLTRREIQPSASRKTDTGTEQKR